VCTALGPPNTSPRSLSATSHPLQPTFSFPRCLDPSCALLAVREGPTLDSAFCCTAFTLAGTAYTGSLPQSAAEAAFFARCGNADLLPLCALHFSERLWDARRLDIADLERVYPSSVMRAFATDAGSVVNARPGWEYSTRAVCHDGFPVVTWAEEPHLLNFIVRDFGAEGGQRG